MRSKQPQLPAVVSACPDCGKYPTLRKVADPFGEEDFYWSYGCDCTMAVDTNKNAVYECYGYPDVVQQWKFTSASIEDMAGKYNKNFTLLLNTILEMSEQQQDQLLKHAIGIKDNRHKSRIPCLIYAKHDVGGESENSFILDINTYGAFVETEKDFKKGENIYISFFDPFNNRTIRITGNIVRKENNGFGVRFDKYSFLIECLDEFLSELTKFSGAVINYDGFLHAFGVEVWTTAGADEQGPAGKVDHHRYLREFEVMPDRYSTNYATLLSLILNMSDEQHSRLLRTAEGILTHKARKKGRITNDYAIIFGFGVLLGCIIMSSFFVGINIFAWPKQALSNPSLPGSSPHTQPRQSISRNSSKG